MALKILAKQGMPEWIDQLTRHHQLFGPVQRQEQTVFAAIQAAEDMDLTYRSTLLPPKKLLLPPRELLFRFAGNGGAPEVDVELPTQATVIFGLHTCDLHAIALLDQVYGTRPADQHYLARRHNSTLVSIECLQPCSQHAFCKDMGTLVTPEFFDLHLIDLGTEYGVQVGSDKGAALVKDLAALREPLPADYQHLNRVLSEKWPRFPYRLQADISELPGLLWLSYRSQEWQQLGEKCLGCGACTLVCPTCTCFDVCDEVDFSLDAGGRSRVWDSCQFRQFATVAGGHDFRQGTAARLRHRFNRKYQYQATAAGMVGCVGCGRCAQACLVEITPVAVLNKLQQQRAAARGAADRRPTILQARQEVRS